MFRTALPCRLTSASEICLLAAGLRSHARGMFVVSEADATAIRTAFEQGGELSAAVELRRLFPGLANNETARLYARTIAGWTPLPATPATPS
jgi:hypothetical protein